MAVAPTGLEIYGPRQDQAEFLDRGNRFVEEGLKLYHEETAREKPTQELFRDLLDLFAKGRREIADLHGSEDAEQFGKPRPRHFKGNESTLLTEGRCRSFSQAMTDRLIKDLHENARKYSSTRSQKALREMRIEEGKVCGLTTRVEIEVVPPSSHFPWGIPLNREIDSAFATLGYSKETVLEPPYDAEKSREFKTKFPVLYQRIVKRMAVHHFFPIIGPDSSPYYLIMVTKRVDRVAMSRLLLMLSREGTSTVSQFAKIPVSESVPSTPTLVIHQDPFLIERTLDRAAEFFGQAMAWEPVSGLEKLKESVGMVVYFLAHAMPYERGSATITEWMEQLVYKHHGFTLPRIEERNIDLQAMTSWLAEEFIAKYQETTALT